MTLSDAKYGMRCVLHPPEAKSFDTERPREEFLFPNIMTDGKLNDLIESPYDRQIVGAVPARRASDFVDRQIGNILTSLGKAMNEN